MPARVCGQLSMRFQKGDMQGVGKLLHPECVLAMGAPPGRELYGRQGVLDVLDATLPGGLEMAVTALRDVAPDTALVVGVVRVGDALGGHTTLPAASLCRIRDGMLFRMATFRSEEEALAATRAGPQRSFAGADPEACHSG